MQIMAKAHRAKNEIYGLVAEVKGCTEKEAKQVNLVEFIRELAETEGLKDFILCCYVPGPRIAELSGLSNVLVKGLL